MTENYLNYLKQKLINKFDQKESHVEYYGKYDQCETYYLYTSEIEDIVEEFFEEEKKLVP